MQQPKFKDAIANMTFKEKKDYIWEYYKLHIIATLVVTALVGYTIFEANRNRDVHVSLVVTGGFATVENVGNLTDHLSQSLLNENQKQDYQILVRSIPFSVTDENPSVDNVQMLFVLLAVGEIDLIIVDEPTLDDMMKQESFLPLNELNIDLDGLDIIERDGQPIGINVDDNELFSDIFFSEGWILSVAINSERLEEVEDALNYIIEH